MQNKLKIQKGDFILSLPSSNPLDLQFSRSVILIADHTIDGSIGFILNKPLNLTLNQLIPTTDSSLSVFEGGPVEKDKIFCVHSRPELILDSQHITDNLYWGGDFDQIFTLLNQNALSKHDIRFFLGYSGWDCQQLHNEMEDDYWVKTNSINTDDLFSSKTTTEKFWKNCLVEQGKEYEIWSNAPENPNLN
ncbi:MULTISPECIES: YqgE/AlgH family protein [Myroides]|uniref:YqgE/AlgH family protein n=1 Tax=Myroides albus TaxID=2562892 RepID=A0A6I3LIW5_9FLAO|nr:MULTISPECIES: YqgE/AlgH family protein [Myroides]MTG97757.1 YqgE/AlgH family protein [Myroides albus]MVX37037.1 YqgE/AlgH family protein [Myroides sp. LoEW2-1]UVD78694.1 YqgE/AlgH family protein [Myroides albus]